MFIVLCILQMKYSEHKHDHDIGQMYFLFEE